MCARAWRGHAGQQGRPPRLRDRDTAEHNHTRCDSIERAPGWVARFRQDWASSLARVSEMDVVSNVRLTRLLSAV